RTVSGVMHARDVRTGPRGMARWADGAGRRRVPREVGRSDTREDGLHAMKPANRPPTAPRPLDNRQSPAYTSNMSNERPKPASTPCLCNALRQATRAVSRLYDEELRGAGLRTTQYSLLLRLRSAGEVRQRDLGGLTSLDETTLTRSLRPLIDAGWVAVRPGEDRREKLVRLTDAGPANP